VEVSILLRRRNDFGTGHRIWYKNIALTFSSGAKFLCIYHLSHRSFRVTVPAGSLCKEHNSLESEKVVVVTSRGGTLVYLGEVCAAKVQKIEN